MNHLYCEQGPAIRILIIQSDVLIPAAGGLDCLELSSHLFTHEIQELQQVLAS
jgi:hypothetical protein